ncbi:MAG: twin-arginine translocation signal domain-containing protein [Proteobacteria bacterium]|nr:twin-arginine translocation signal domain-containing protein [Pseudomonadota bacterium]
MTNRRQFLSGLAALIAAGVIAPEDALAGPRGRKRRKKKRRVRRKVRRRVRRRHRRRVRRRTVRGRNLWVVPPAVAVGWELMLDDKVVVVKERRTETIEDVEVTVLVVVDDAGKEQELEVHLEDDETNGQLLAGSVLPEEDTTTPATEGEEEVEEWVEEE